MSRIAQQLSARIGAGPVAQIIRYAAFASVFGIVATVAGQEPSDTALQHHAKLRASMKHAAAAYLAEEYTEAALHVRESIRSLAELRKRAEGSHLQKEISFYQVRARNAARALSERGIAIPRVVTGYDELKGHMVTISFVDIWDHYQVTEAQVLDIQTNDEGNEFTTIVVKTASGRKVYGRPAIDSITLVATGEKFQLERMPMPVTVARKTSPKRVVMPPKVDKSIMLKELTGSRASITLANGESIGGAELARVIVDESSDCILGIHVQLADGSHKYLPGEEVWVVEIPSKFRRKYPRAAQLIRDPEIITPRLANQIFDFWARSGVRTVHLGNVDFTRLTIREIMERYPGGTREMYKIPAGLDCERYRVGGVSFPFLDVDGVPSDIVVDLRYGFTERVLREVRRSK